MRVWRTEIKTWGWGVHKIAYKVPWEGNLVLFTHILLIFSVIADFLKKDDKIRMSTEKIIEKLQFYWERGSFSFFRSLMSVKSKTSDQFNRSRCFFFILPPLHKKAASLTLPCARYCYRHCLPVAWIDYCQRKWWEGENIQVCLVIIRWTHQLTSWMRNGLSYSLLG